MQFDTQLVFGITGPVSDGIPFVEARETSDFSPGRVPAGPSRARDGVQIPHQLFPPNTGFHTTDSANLSAVERFKLQSPELFSRLEKVVAQCLDPARFDVEKTVSKDYQKFFTESYLGKSMTRSLTCFWRNTAKRIRDFGNQSNHGVQARGVGALRAGEIAERVVGNLLRETRAKYLLPESQSIGLAARAARTMVKYRPAVNPRSLWAETPRILEESSGMCTELVEVTRAFLSAMDVETEEVSIDPIHGVVSANWKWTLFHVSTYPLILAGFHHKLIRTRLEDGKDYYFDPLLMVDRRSGSCQFIPADREGWKKGDYSFLNERSKAILNEVEIGKARVSSWPYQLGPEELRPEQIRSFLHGNTKEVYRLAHQPGTEGPGGGRSERDLDPVPLPGGSPPLAQAKARGLPRLDEDRFLVARGDGALAVVSVFRKDASFEVQIQNAEGGANHFSDLVIKKIPLTAAGFFLVGEAQIPSSDFEGFLLHMTEPSFLQGEERGIEWEKFFSDPPDRDTGYKRGPDLPSLGLRPASITTPISSST
jgi:hypothetical protein